VFKADREKKRNDASFQYWGRGKIFDSIQEILREGSKCLSEEEREKYVISVTHDEVNRGLLHNPDCDDQAFYFQRIIQGMDEELATDDKVNNAIASSFKDSIPIENDPCGRRRPDSVINTNLENMQTRCIQKMNPSNVATNTVPWVRGAKMSKNNDKPPDEWLGYLESLSCQLITALCESIFSKYRKPTTDALENELVSQTNSVLAKKEVIGFSRDDKLAMLHSYIEDTRGSKLLVVHGKSGVGKSWSMCKFISQLSDKHRDEKKITMFYRLLGTSQHSSDAFSLINSLYLQYNAVLGREGGSLKDWEEAKKWMLEGIIQWPQDQGTLVIVLDSIDQLTWANMALDNLDGWIPGLRSALPDNVRVVVSTLPEVTSDHGTVKLLLPKLQSFGVTTVELLPFDITDKDKVIASFELLAAALPTRGVILPVKKVLTEAVKELLWEITCIDSSPLCISIALGII